MIWRVIKIILKSLGILFGVVVLLIMVYIIFNTPFGSKYKKVSEADLKPYLDYLDTHTSDPLQFVSEKFKKYDVVLIGEMHRRKQDLEFIKSLIPYLYEKNGVTIIGWEFGSSYFQSEVDALVNASEFDQKKAMGLMRRWSWYWNYQEYSDIYRVIWELNKKIPQDKEKIRFLQLGSDYSERKLRSPDRQIRMQEAQRYDYDKKMADIIEREALLKGKKALWYSGLHHAFTRYRQPRLLFQFRRGEKRRGGNFLYDKYPDRVQLTTLHIPVMGRWSVFGWLIPSLEKHSKFYYPFGGVFDKVYERWKRPFAVDTALSPFGKLKDNYSFYSLDYWGGIRAKDFCDGYIVLCSFNEAQAVTPIGNWVTSQAELEEIKEKMLPADADKIKDISHFLNNLEGEPGNRIKTIHDVIKKGY